MVIIRRCLFKINYGRIDPKGILGEGIKLLGEQSSSAMTINGKDNAAASYGDEIIISVNIKSQNEVNTFSRSADIDEVDIYAKRGREDSFLIGTASVDGSYNAELKIKLKNEEDRGIYWMPGDYTLSAYYGGGGEKEFTPSESSAALKVSKGEQSADQVTYDITDKDSKGFSIVFSDVSSENSGNLEIKTTDRNGKILMDWADAEPGSPMKLLFGDDGYLKLYLRYAGNDFYFESLEAGPYEIKADDTEEPSEPVEPGEPSEPEKPSEPEEPSDSSGSDKPVHSKESGRDVSGPVRIIYYTDGNYNLSGITDGSFETVYDTSSADGGKSTEGLSWRFRLSDGSYAKNQWIRAFWNGEADWYYIGEEGLLKVGWFTDKDGNVYYLHPLHDGSFGYMYTGEQIIDGVQYYFSKGEEDGLPEGALKR